MMPLLSRSRLSDLLQAISLVIGLAGLWPEAVRADILPIASAAELHAALATVPAGTVLSLAPGNYGAPEIKASPVRPRGSAPVTIRSADPARPAELSGLAIKGAGGLVFENVYFRYRFDPTKDAELNRIGTNWPIQILGAEAITIRNSLFEGDYATQGRPEDIGFATSTALIVRQTAGLRLERNEFHTWKIALAIDNSSDVVIKHNNIHAIRLDAMELVALDTAVIEGNYMHAPKRSPTSADHADMIQFWTAGTKVPSRNITIRGNVFNSGRGLYTQSIFMRNERVDQKQAGREMFYRNILIEQNVILNAHLHGITLGEADGVTIRNNTLIHNRLSDGPTDNPPVWTPRINVSPAADNVTITGNITAGIEGGKTRPDWVVRDNLIVQDRSRAGQGFYDTVFAAARTGDPETLAPFTYLASGPADGRRFGAAMLRPDRIAATMRGLPGADRNPATAKDEPTALMQVALDPVYVNRFRFDAGLSQVPKGQTPRYRWDFGSKRAEGAVVTHDFADPGRHDVALTVTLASGATARTAAFIDVPFPEVLQFDPARGGLLIRRGDQMLRVTDVPLAAGGRAIPLGQGHAPLQLPREAIAGFFGAETFDLKLRLRTRSADNPAGEILRVHQALVMGLTASGALQVQMFAPNGKGRPTVVQASSPDLFDGDWHDIVLRYDGRLLVLAVDGKVRAQGRATGPVGPMRSWGLSFGNPFGQKSVDGEIAAVDLRVNDARFAR